MDCKTCGDTGEVHWDHTDEYTGDHVPMTAPCPDCKKKMTEQERLQKQIEAIRKRDPFIYK